MNAGARPVRAGQCENERMRRSVNFDSNGSILSIGSAGSILSIGSAGSILSIGSAGSILSIGSAGSVASVLSAGSAASVGSVLSALSCWSVLAWRSRQAGRDLLMVASALSGRTVPAWIPIRRS
jgi:hypothetical protein